MLKFEGWLYLHSVFPKNPHFLRPLALSRWAICEATSTSVSVDNDIDPFHLWWNETMLNHSRYFVRDCGSIRKSWNNGAKKEIDSVLKGTKVSPSVLRTIFRKVTFKMNIFQTWKTHRVLLLLPKNLKNKVCDTQHYYTYISQA